MKIHTPPVVVEQYGVGPGKKNLVMQVTIGDAQAGGWAATLGGKVLKGADEPVDLGKGSQLKGKILQVKVAVKDIRPETNRLSEVISLSGGTAAKQYPQFLAESATDDGDLAIFTAVFFFK
jgi:hypothetical protein